MNTHPAITIRPFKKSDGPACLAAFESNVPKSFTRDEIAEYMEFLNALDEASIKTAYYVIQSDGRVVGCGGFGQKFGGEHLTLAWGLIHADFQKTGLGEQLLKFRLNEVDRLYPGHQLFIDTTQHAFGFFEKFGFETIKITEHFYAENLHRYDMVYKGQPRHFE